MNKQGNARASATKEKIRNALMYLLKHKKFNDIYVKDVCAIACINRSSFYAHYQDINDLMIQTENELSKQMNSIFDSFPVFNNENYIRLFEFIRENKEFYRAYLKNNDCSFMAQSDFKNRLETAKNFKVQLAYTESEMLYHMAFFGAGLNAVCKIWLMNGMQETPEQLAEIIKKEYGDKVKYFKD